MGHQSLWQVVLFSDDLAQPIACLLSTSFLISQYMNGQEGKAGWPHNLANTILPGSSSSVFWIREHLSPVGGGEQEEPVSASCPGPLKKLTTWYFEG